MLKKSLLCLLVATSVNAKEVSGTGEFRFGPETAQNVACDIAEQKAKENAIANFVGEYIEHQTNQICRDEQCTEFRTLFSETSGKVKNVIDKKNTPFVWTSLIPFSIKTCFIFLCFNLSVFGRLSLNGLSSLTNSNSINVPNRVLTSNLLIESSK